MIWDVHPGSGSWYFTHPGSRSQKKATDPGYPEHCPSAAHMPGWSRPSGAGSLPAGPRSPAAHTRDKTCARPRTSRPASHNTTGVINPAAVLRIHDILVQVRIHGSIPLTNGSGSECGSGSCYQWPWRRQQKIRFFYVFVINMDTHGISILIPAFLLSTVLYPDPDK